MPPQYKYICCRGRNLATNNLMAFAFKHVMLDDPNPKVLHIASGDLWAGAEVQLYTLAKTLHHKTGTSVAVVLLNRGLLEKKLLDEGIPITVLDETQLNGPQILRRLVQVIKVLKPVVIHTHRMKENVLGSLAAWLAGGIPSLRTVHGAPEHTASWRTPHKWALNELDWLCARFLQQRIVAVSNPLGNALRKKLPPQKIVVIENGIDLATVAAPLSRSRNRGDGNRNPFRIGIAGRLVPVKRVDIFLHTAQLFRNRHPHVAASFHVYGDGPLRSELERLRDQLGLSNTVIFEGHCSDLPVQLAQLDVLMMTSDHEGLPMVLLEAMALGVPIVAHAVGGILELLDDGACGLLVKEQEAATYCQALESGFGNMEHLTVMAERAKTRAIQRYSASANAQFYIGQYAAVRLPGSHNACVPGRKPVGHTSESRP